MTRKLGGMELWSLDEMRLGLRTDLGRRITIKGIKPLGHHWHVYQYGYIFGAVNLQTGEGEFLEAEACNGSFFQHFLEQISRVNPLKLKVILLDNGAFHKRKDLVVPPNVVLLFLPPYTPELNPIERFWQEVRRQLKGRVLSSLEDLNRIVREFLLQLSPEATRKTVGYPVYEKAIQTALNLIPNK